MDLTQSMHKATHHLSHDLFGGPRLLKFNWVINFQKGSTFLWVLGLMWYFGNWSAQGWVYLVLHGSYGILWIIKDQVFPDAKFQAPITLAGGLVAILAVLGPYWLAPYLLISPVLGEAHVGASTGWLVVAGFAYVFGVVLMLGSDAQKFYTLKFRKELITDGFFKRVRHPNYLGEMMIYGSFALVAWHWLPCLVLAWVWGGYFSVNIAMKERSMSRYSEWSEYKAHTNYLIPFIF